METRNIEFCIEAVRTEIGGTLATYEVKYARAELAALLKRALIVEQMLPLIRPLAQWKVFAKGGPGMLTFETRLRAAQWARDYLSDTPWEVRPANSVAELLEALEGGEGSFGAPPS